MEVYFSVTNFKIAHLLAFWLYAYGHNTESCQKQPFFFPSKRADLPALSMGTGVFLGIIAALE
jgi:hypothetical protein